MAACASVNGCNHGEAPRNTSSSDSQNSSATTAATAGDTSTACVSPTPSTPPPTAEPADECPVDPGNAAELGSAQITFPDAPSSPIISVEVATTDAARERGLMYRTSLPENSGMLFAWDSEERRSFWMRNTCIPLDMLFIAGDGTIAGVLEQVPVLNLKSRTVPCPAQYVLEVNAGWCREHGVVAGQHLVIQR